MPAGGSAEVVVEVPVDRLATRDPEQHTWRPADGGHRFVVARHAGDPDAVVIDLDL